MIRDPLYRQIVAALEGPLNGNLFEHCAVDLLRHPYPTIVPIMGGSDSGMDGAVANLDGPPFPLVCTTGKDVIRNLANNLSKYKEDGGDARRAILATSQRLTPRRRENLFEKAVELGFNLCQVHDQTDIADRLYRNPAWCNELLGITGERPALSAVPMTIRPVIGGDIIGREADIEWLNSPEGDRLLIGQPGAGKTFALRSIVLNGSGLFVVDDDIGHIRNAIRSEEPRVLIVDDAHVRLSLLVAIRQLREHIDEDFAIVAAAWPGTKDQLTETLSLPASAIRSLDLLDRNQIVNVVSGVGIRRPNELVRMIVDQSEGRPGLAVTLANLCLQGDIRGVALGDALSRNIRTTVTPLVGERSTLLLASFALERVMDFGRQG